MSGAPKRKISGSRGWIKLGGDKKVCFAAAGNGCDQIPPVVRLVWLRMAGVVKATLIDRRF